MSVRKRWVGIRGTDIGGKGADIEDGVMGLKFKKG